MIVVYYCHVDIVKVYRILLLLSQGFRLLRQRQIILSYPIWAASMYFILRHLNLLEIAHLILKIV